jgi:hypothetical protein
MIRFVVLFSLVAIVLPVLSGCSSQQMLYRGFYTWGPEVNEFSPCASGKRYWVVTTPALHELLASTHETGRTEPYQGLFVEVRVFYAGPASVEIEKGGPFAEQTDGLFEITEVRAMRRPMASDCQ